MKTILRRFLIATLSVVALLPPAGCAREDAAPPASTGTGHEVAPHGQDAVVPGTGYHATGFVPCTMGPDATARQQCDFGVVRETPGSGNGSVTVTRPDGVTRTIFFEAGEATGYDADASEPAEFAASREEDTTIVTIGAERYWIFDAVIWGG